MYTIQQTAIIRPRLVSGLCGLSPLKGGAPFVRVESREGLSSDVWAAHRGSRHSGGRRRRHRQPRAVVSVHHGGGTGSHARAHSHTRRQRAVVSAHYGGGTGSHARAHSHTRRLPSRRWVHEASECAAPSYTTSCEAGEAHCSALKAAWLELLDRLRHRAWPFTPRREMPRRCTTLQKRPAGTATMRGLTGS